MSDPVVSAALCARDGALVEDLAADLALLGERELDGLDELIGGRSSGGSRARPRWPM